MHARNGMNAFYGILSDISLATVGVFVLMFVILIVISNRDVAQLMSENGRMVAAARSIEDEVTAKRNAADEFIQFQVKRAESSLKKVIARLEEARREHADVELQIVQAKAQVKPRLDLPEISEEEVRRLLETSRLMRDHVDEVRKQIGLKLNHVRQEFNVYKEKAGKRPCLRFGVRQMPDSNGITRNWITLSSMGTTKYVLASTFRSPRPQ